MSYPPVIHQPTAPRPPGISRALVFCVAVAAFVGGGLVSMAFNEVADLRPYVPPVFSPAATLACGDVDAYVRHVKDLNDHHVRTDTFGIHRQKTVDAVNELYDRARCNATQDDYGHETYKTLTTRTIVDSNDPPAVQAAPAEPPRSYPLYSHGELVSPATAPAPAVAPSRPAVIVTNRHRSVSLPRRTSTVDDAADVGTLGPKPRSYMAEELQAGTPAGAQDPAKAPPLHCGREANGIDWHRAGCP